jgi:hypothetical protein
MASVSPTDDSACKATSARTIGIRAIVIRTIVIRTIVIRVRAPDPSPARHTRIAMATMKPS